MTVTGRGARSQRAVGRGRDGAGYRDQELHAQHPRLRKPVPKPLNPKP